MRSVAALPAVQQGKNLADCVSRLSAQGGGWCEIRAEGDKPSISSVWPARPSKMPQKLHMGTGPKSILIAWNSAAFDEKRGLFYFTGGGHADYGGNEVYEFDLNAGKWSRLTNPSPLDLLYVLRDYKKSASKPWRRLCWVQDVTRVPASPHTYDGLIFSKRTSTAFLYVMDAANGACFEDKNDRYRNNPAIVGQGRRLGLGWYEFNPSRAEVRNGLAPLAWRRLFDGEVLSSASVSRGYPVSTELDDGRLVFGSKSQTVVYDPTRPAPTGLQPFSQQADWGDGLMTHDAGRGLIWSLHQKGLLAFDARTGKQLRKIDTRIAHGKSLAVNKHGQLVSWDGTNGIYLLDPDAQNPAWQLLDWSGKGPSAGDRRVYGKWVYLREHDVFAGIASHKTGFWIYKQPDKFEPTVFSEINAQSLIDQAKPGTVVTIPPGVYSGGLFVGKSLTLNLSGADLRGVAHGKGIINVNCNRCRVVLQEFDINGRKAGCLSGNCAGIKAEGQSFELIVRRGHIDNTVMGILTDNRGGRLTIEDTLIENTGLKDTSNTLGHGVYAGKIDQLVIRRSRILRPFGDGHIVKSRAPDTLIEDSIIAGLDGYHSRTIDFPCGGNLIIRNSTLQHSSNADNNDLISVGTEGKVCGQNIPPSSVRLRNNWIIIDRDRSADERARDYGPTAIFNWRAPVKDIEVSGNRIVEPTGELQFAYQDTLPDMMDKNRLFDSREVAGLGSEEVPAAPAKKTGN